MSHFTVMVIGDNPEDQLAPYHEFECTGVSDQYIKNIDVTEDRRKEYESGTVFKIRDLNGKLHDTYDDQFHRDPTKEERDKIGSVAGTGCGHGMSWSSKDWGDGKGYRTKVHFIPEGYEKIEIAQKEAGLFVEFITNYNGIKAVPVGELPDLEDEHKYGYCLLDSDGDVVQVINRTNPDSKWDWHSLGGRWRGYFKLKPGRKGTLGNPGVSKNKLKYDVDQALKGDIDFAWMVGHSREVG